MLNTTNNVVLVRIPIAPTTITTNGGAIKCFTLAQGFCFAEYDDGNVFPISNPLEEWLMSVKKNSENVPNDTQIYFTFEAEGARGNPGKNDDGRSLTDIQTVL